MNKADIIKIGKPIVDALDKREVSLRLMEANKDIYPIYNVFTVKTQHITGILEDLYFIFGANNVKAMLSWQEQSIIATTNNPDMDYISLSEETHQAACDDTVEYINNICQSENWTYPDELTKLVGRVAWGAIQDYLEAEYGLWISNYFYYIYMSKWEVRKREKVLTDCGIMDC